MSAGPNDPLDPLIHVSARLRLMVTLAALHEGDSLSFRRLQDVVGLTPGNLITHLRKLEDAGYLSSTKSDRGNGRQTSVSLTTRGRDALDAYRVTLSDLVGEL